ncbi:tetratricopeptide repeat protein 28-like [Montipora capricornis]|uniref:tetratricopeptide repeat protein 28-like n=1 Tax=Montipora capricornis TaxID=246305 RepID=UPI0035F18035
MFMEAIDYHKHHLGIAKELGLKAGEGEAYANLGYAYASLGNFKQAIEYYEQYLSIAKEVGDRAGEGAACANLGNTYTSLGNFKEAIEYHEHHLSIAKEVGDRAGEGKAYGSLGNAYASLGNFEQAIKYHQICLGIAKEVRARLVEGAALHSLGRDHESSGSLGDALSCYLLSIEHFDQMRLSLQSKDAWKISFRHLNKEAYVSLWRVLLKNGEIEEALYAAEKGRAQALRDILNEQYGIDSHSFSKIASKETLLSPLDFVSSQTVFVALDGNTISFWVLRKGSKILFRQKEISQGIPDLMVKTFLKEIGVRGGVRCEDRSLDNLRSNLPLSRKPSSGKTHRSSNSSINTLQPLYDVLIRPIVDLLQSDELIVVPDGPFCLAPYCALSESIRIRTAPSLTFLKMIADASEDFHSKTGALLVGDPWLKEVTNEDGKPILEQLPCAKEEVKMIGELLKTAPLTGRNATKSEVLRKMESVALVHIAAHGGQESGEIALAPNPQRQSSIPKEEDFILKVSDVQAVCLRARLVVLSCCHSGRGEVKSEGVVGIARAFLCAGARSVLVSLWAIDDKATLLFMRSFYQHLVAGKSASAALHQAMKSLRESKQYCAVKHWAPFMLFGDDVTLEIRRK